MRLRRCVASVSRAVASSVVLSCPVFCRGCRVRVASVSRRVAVFVASVIQVFRAANPAIWSVSTGIDQRPRLSFDAPMSCPVARRRCSVRRSMSNASTAADTDSCGRVIRIPAEFCGGRSGPRRRLRRLVLRWRAWIVLRHATHEYACVVPLLGFHTFHAAPTYSA